MGRSAPQHVPGKDDPGHTETTTKGLPATSADAAQQSGHAAALRLQRRAGNKTATACLLAAKTFSPFERVDRSLVAPISARSGQPRIQRKGGYLVCSAGKDTTELPGDPHKRHYKWVAELPAGVAAAKDHPSWKWYTLYEVSESVGPVRGEPDAAVNDEDEGRADESEDQQPAGDPSAPKAEQKPVRKKKRKPKKKAATPVAPTESVSAEVPVTPSAPAEPEWVPLYRTTAASKLGMKPDAIKANIPYLTKDLAAKAKSLEAQITELQAAWLAVLGSFEDKAGSLRAEMPEWDGDAGAIIKVFPKMDGHVSNVKTYVADVKKLAALQSVLGATHTTDLLNVFSVRGVLGYCTKVGQDRLVELMTTHGVGAAALNHYGPDLMRTFVGAADQLWAHLTTASLNDKGVVSGGHDESVFNAFIAKAGYKIKNPPASPPDAYKIVYEDDKGVTKGSKTLIKGLKAGKGTWMPVLKEAVWRAVAAKRLSNGAFWTDDSTGQVYDGFYDKGSDEVTTMWPR